MKYSRFFIFTILLLSWSLSISQVEVNTDNSVNIGLQNLNDAKLTLIETESKYGFYNRLDDNNSVPTRSAIYNKLTHSGTGIGYGIENRVTAANSATDIYGMVNSAGGTGNYFYGLYNSQNGTANRKYGLYNYNSGSLTSNGKAYGIMNYNNIQGGSTTYGIQNLTYGYATSATYGIDNKTYARSNSTNYGVANWVYGQYEGGTGTLYGVYSHVGKSSNITAWNGQARAIYASVHSALDGYAGYFSGAKGIYVSKNSALGIRAGYFSGEVYAFNGYAQGSDERLKEDIKEIEGGLSILREIRPTHYLMKDEVETFQRIGQGPAPRRYGFVAQELREVIPDLVTLVEQPGELKTRVIQEATTEETPEGDIIETPEEIEEYRDMDGEPMYAIRYNSLIPMTVAAIQEQDLTIQNH